MAVIITEHLSKIMESQSREVMCFLMLQASRLGVPPTLRYLFPYFLF